MALGLRTPRPSFGDEVGAFVNLGWESLDTLEVKSSNSQPALAGTRRYVDEVGGGTSEASRR